MRFIDTHSHIYDEAFSQEEDAAVERAVRAGVTKIILPDIDSSSRESMFALALRHPGTLFPCVGLHPTSIAENWQEEMDKVRSHLDKDIRAIGEIGIDCYWSKDFLDQQKEAFIQQLHIAHEKNLPVIIHSRESTGIILDILNSHKHLNLRGVFHIFGKRHGQVKPQRQVAVALLEAVDLLFGFAAALGQQNLGILDDGSVQRGKAVGAIGAAQHAEHPLKLSLLSRQQLHKTGQCPGFYNTHVVYILSQLQ